MKQPATRPKALDDLDLARQALRAAMRIVTEAENAYRDLTGEPPPTQLFTCARCREPRAGSDFRTVPTRHGWRRFSYCRPCQRAVNRASYQRHRDSHRTRNAGYRRANRERLNARTRERYAENREAVRAYQNAWARQRREAAGAAQAS